MITIKSKTIPNTKDRISKPIDDDYSVKYFKREFGLEEVFE